MPITAHVWFDFTQSKRVKDLRLKFEAEWPHGFSIQTVGLSADSRNLALAGKMG